MMACALRAFARLALARETEVFEMAARACPGVTKCSKWSVELALEPLGCPSTTWPLEPAREREEEREGKRERGGGEKKRERGEKKRGGKREKRREERTWTTSVVQSLCQTTSRLVTQV
jgi:hypothetical protein